MHVEHPSALALVVLVPAVWRLIHHDLAGLLAPRWRPAAFAAVALALAGVSIDAGRGPITAVVALDRSASIDAAARRAGMDRVASFAASMADGDRLGLVLFGADAAVVFPPVVSANLGDIVTKVDGNGTNIAGAIAVARQSLPLDGARRIALITDGRQTAGHADAEAIAAGAAGIPIDVVLPPTSRRGRLRVARVDAPAEAHARQPFAVSVDVEGEPGSSGRVTVYRDDALAATRVVTTGPAGETTVAFTETPDRPGILTYRAVVEDDLAGDDVADADPSRGAVVNVFGEQRVLYVASANRVVARALASAFRLDAMTPDELPTAVGEFAAYDLIVLDDVDGSRVADAAAAAIAARVRDGGAGLLVLGTPATLRAADLHLSPLEPLLPIDLRPRGGRRAPSRALVLVFDRSGSMSELSDGLSKIEAARKAVSGVVDVLSPDDALGVIAFNGSPAAVAPLAPVMDRASLDARLSTIEPVGSTAIAPAVDLAIRWLKGGPGQSASRRHVLLVSDGRTTPEDAERLRSTVRHAGVPVSVVAIGVSADRRLLDEVAASSGGRALFPDRVRDLPAMVADEAAQATSGSTVREPFVPRASSHALLASIDTQSIPPLGGYVVGAVKPAATAVLSSPLGDPVFCAWQAGIGRAAVFTGDLEARGSARFVAWREWPRFWAQAARWLSAGGERDGWRVAVDDGSGTPSIALELEGAAAAEIERATADVRLPDGTVRRLPMRPLAAGRFEAPLDHAPTGAYTVSVDATDARGLDERIVRGVYWNADRERAAAAPDLALLRRIAALSGGRVLGAVDSPFAAPRRARRIDLSPLLAIVSLVMVLAELVTGDRPIRWPPFFRRAAWTHPTL